MKQREKSNVHRAFDRLWQSGQMSRAQAYRLLATWTARPSAEAHFGILSPHEVRRVRDELRRFA